MNTDSKASGPVIDSVTITSLGVVVLILQFAYLASRQFLARDTPGKLRVLFIWHVFNALVHLCMEGSFLYNCLFVFAPHDPSLPFPENNFQGLSPIIASVFSPLFPALFPSNTSATDATQYVYGARHGTGPTSLLWQEYEKADSRWGGADLTVVSLELLTVVIGAPLALWCAWGIARRRRDAGFWMTVLAVGELYGGFMTFAPEWLIGSPSLDTSNWMYLWLYLFFFNVLWVIFPLMSIFVFYEDMSNAFKMRSAVYAASAKARASAEKIKSR